jgi:hypothetical protein
MFVLVRSEPRRLGILGHVQAERPSVPACDPGSGALGTVQSRTAGLFPRLSLSLSLRPGVGVAGDI